MDLPVFVVDIISWLAFYTVLWVFDGPGHVDHMFDMRSQSGSLFVIAQTRLISDQVGRVYT